MVAKKTRKTQVPTARLVIILCAIALTLWAWSLTSISFKVLNTQWRLFSYYSDIQDANSKHDYYYNQALLHPNAGYMDDAEEWDYIAKKLLSERKLFVATATDSTVIWASRDGVEVLTVLAGVTELLIALALWAIDGFIVVTLVSQSILARRRRLTRLDTNSSSKPYHARRSKYYIAP